MRHRAAVMLVALAALTTMAGTAIAGSDNGSAGGFAAEGLADPSRGLVYDGLAPGASDGPCSGAFEIQLANGEVICTQGPDGAPADVDIFTSDSMSENAAATTDTGAEFAASAACIGDGVSGPRVQAVYAVAADQVDRYEIAEPYIAQWAAEVDRVFEVSAVEAGGTTRNVRWATSPDCELDVAHVVVSPSGDDTFGNMINEMMAQGFTSPDRKYLVWMDARVYCGIGQFQIDDRPGQENRNNGAVPMFARTDAGCWGLSQSVEAHELVHALGAVQRSAPHSTAHGHCWDEYDLMCYNDRSGVPMQAVCASSAARYLDCNFDDYFNPNPAEGSYLAGHWNTADSRFLEAGSPDDGGSPAPPPPPPEPPPPPPDPEPTPPPPPGTPEPPTPNQAPEVDAGPNVEGRAGEWITLVGSVIDDGLPRGQLAVRWASVTGPGTVSFENDRAAVTRVRFSTPGTYVLRLRGGDSDLAAIDRTNVRVVDVNGEASGDMVTEVFAGSIPVDRTLDRIVIASSAGPAELTLSATGRIRHGRAPTMILKVFDPDGQLIAISRARSPVALSVDLPESALYTYAIRAARGTTYTLEITHVPL